MSSLHLLLLVTAVSCCSGQIDFQNQPISDQGTSLFADCIFGEYSCSDNCLQVIFCTSSGPLVVDTCSSVEGTVCSAATHQCVTGTVCEHPPQHGPINCNAIGYFPDPVFCEDYHLCSEIGSRSTQQTCPTPSAYNPLTTLCTLGQADRVCVEGPIPKCVSPGDVGAQVENPNIYYVCVKNGSEITPEMYKCPPSEIFVDTKCVSVSSGSTSSPSTSTSSSSSTTSTSSVSPSTTPTTTPVTTTMWGSTTMPGSTTTPYPCPGMGQFPDPLDCYSYYLCFEDLQATHFRCQTGYYFHSSERGCVTGTCSN